MGKKSIVSVLRRFGIPASMLACVFCLSLALSACSAGQSGDVQSGRDSSEEVTASAEEDGEDASFTAHGSSYSKSETVTASTGFDGEVDGISVSEWIKNPDELDTIEDVSTLQSIVADDSDIGCTIDGDSVVWQAGGSDVSYTGITDQDLPFSVSYSFKLDGKTVSAEDLDGAEGSLEICIEYENDTEESITVGSSVLSVQQPYVMASIIAFDAEHAKNVEIDNGTVIDQDGSLIAVGVGMPGLAETLGLEEMVDLPESVTITADVVGFEMPDVTTMATNQLLSAIDGGTLDDAGASIDGIFSQVDSIQTALTQLSTGIEAIDTALASINEGQTALNEAFPNATEGLGQLALVSEGISTGVEGGSGLVGLSDQSVESALDLLENIDTDGLDEETAQDIEDAIGYLEDARESDASAIAALDQVDTAAVTLTSGLEAAAASLEQIQEGYSQLAEATAQVNEATSTLNTALETMGESIEAALSSAEGTVYAELETIEALSDLVRETGAYCGNAEGMEASTIFVVTASVG